ncbi:hypothetical protein GCM10010279_47860 [Streptomyces mutabilis]|nr:hypothetical protein GCM10010279_47860 [Streptomyces mutabilis]
MRHITTHDAPATGLRGIGDISWHTRGACHGMDVEDADAAFGLRCASRQDRRSMIPSPRIGFPSAKTLAFSK